MSICGVQFFKPNPQSVGSRITSQGHLFRRGEVVVHRDLFGGRIWYARAEIVVEDTVNGPLLTYWGPGAEVRAPVDAVHARPLRLPMADWVLEPRPWHSTHVLSHWCAEDAYSTWLFWETDGWGFAGWYINMQSPFVRTEIGFDTVDNILDVWWSPMARARGRMMMNSTRLSERGHSGPRQLPRFDERLRGRSLRSVVVNLSLRGGPDGGPMEPGQFHG